MINLYLHQSKTNLMKLIFINHTIVKIFLQIYFITTKSKIYFNKIMSSKEYSAKADHGNKSPNLLPIG